MTSHQQRNKHTCTCDNCGGPMPKYSQYGTCQDCKRMTKERNYRRSAYNRASGTLYRIVAGPDIISDFIDLGSRFSYADICLGMRFGWLPNNTVLERDGQKYVIRNGKKEKA